MLNISKLLILLLYYIYKYLLFFYLQYFTPTFIFNKNKFTSDASFSTATALLHSYKVEIGVIFAILSKQSS